MVMMVMKLCFCKWVILCNLLLLVVISAKKHGNPANELVDIINENRTSQRLPKLKNSPGLGCMALQYAEECKGNCSINNTSTCHPSEDDFVEIFAPNCGVELPTITTISGQIVGCQSKYVEPFHAFSRVLVRDKKSVTLVKEKNHTEVGVGMIRIHGGPFFWCILFSNGQTNSTFVLEDGGRGIKQKKGCFSGADIKCSEGKKIDLFLNTILIMVITVFVCCII